MGVALTLGPRGDVVARTLGLVSVDLRIELHGFLKTFRSNATIILSRNLGLHV